MNYNNAIFAGGGSRCFWQMGFWDGANAEGLGLNTSVTNAGSTSAGCAIAMAALLDRGQEALSLFKGYTERNFKNVYWENLAPWKPGRLLPHIDMYHNAMDEFIQDADFQHLREKNLCFLMSAYPRWMGGPISSILGFSVYGLEKKLKNPIHPQWPTKVGFQPLISNVRDCSTKQELISFVLAASCVPPVLPGGTYQGRRVLDGGLIDNVPVMIADDWEGETLVLLSRQYPAALPERPGFTYVQPSKPIEIDKFDYANPNGLQQVYEDGYLDGRKFVANGATSAA